MSMPPRLRRLVLALALALSTALALLAAVPTAEGSDRAAPSARPTSTPIPGSCAAFATRTIAPDTVIVGEPATVTLSVRIDCVPDPFPVHVVLAVDDTTAMATQAGRDVLRALRGWVMGLPTRPGDSTLSVGVVGYRSLRPKVRCPLSIRLDAARRCIDRLTSSGEGDLADGIAAAHDLMKAGRLPGVDPDRVREVIIVVSGGSVGARSGDAVCVRAKKAAGVARGQGALLIVMEVESRPERGCLAGVATSPRYFFTLPGRPPALARVNKVLDAIAKRDIHYLGSAQMIMIADTLPISTSFVAGRFDPPLEVFDEVQALWEIPYIPRAGMTFTYQVRTSAPGLFDVPAWSSLSFVDLRHGTATFLPPPAQLRVLSGFIDPWP